MGFVFFNIPKVAKLKKLNEYNLGIIRFLKITTFAAIMGKDKLRKFDEIGTFANTVQPVDKNILLTRNHELKGNWNKVFFKNDNPIILELGCGKGEYTVGLARLNPRVNYIGVDIKGARIWRGAKTATDENLNNVGFLRTRIDIIDAFFGENEVSEVWLTFSDPQPNKPKKRLTSKLFVDRYKKFLKPNGIINLKCDSDLLYEFTLDEIKERRYKLLINTPNIYEGFIPNSEDEKLNNVLSIRTFYESRWLKGGKKIKYLRFQP